MKKKVDTRIPMPRVFTKKWIKALRSRKYKQTDGTLKGVRGTDKDGNATYGHCCLGVACEVAKVKDISGGAITTRGDISKKFPKSFIKGLLTTHGNSDLENRLIHLNDEKKYKFNKIANYIEKHCKLV